MTKASKIKVSKEMTRKHLARAEREARQQRWMLIGLAVTFVLAFGLLGYGVLNERVLKMQQPVATVNGKNITTAEFQKRVRFQSFQINVQLSQLDTQRQQFASDPSLSFITQQIDQQISSLQSMLSDPPTLGKQVLDRIIEEELVRQEAARRNISVSPDEIQTEIEHSYNFYRVPPTPTPEPTITPTPLASPTPEPTATTSITPTATPGPTDTPEPTATPVTEQAFNTAFSTYLSQIAPTGMTRDDLNQLVKFDLLRQKLQEEFNKNVPTSADQIQFRYIDFETLEKAQEAETQLKSGTSFDDLYNRVQAGDVVSATAYTEPWTPVSDLTSQLDQKITDLILSLGISQTSQIITDTLMPGALIFQQTGRGVQTLSPYQLQTEQQKAYQTWLDTQLNGPGVNYYNNRYLQRIPTQ